MKAADVNNACIEGFIFAYSPKHSRVEKNLKK